MELQIAEVPLHPPPSMGDDPHCDVYMALEGTLTWVTNSDNTHAPSHAAPIPLNPSTPSTSGRSTSLQGGDSSQSSLRRMVHDISKPYDRSNSYDHAHFSGRDTSHSHSSYGATPKDSDSSDAPRRRSRHKQAKRTRKADNPADQQSMNSTERRSRMEILKSKAKLLRLSCKIELPPFIPPTVGRHERHDFGKQMSSWWDWLDKCRHKLDLERSLNGPIYDWGIIDVVFGHLAKLQGLYGIEYTIALEALKQREPWRSAFERTEGSGDDLDDEPL